MRGAETPGGRTPFRDAVFGLAQCAAPRRRRKRRRGFASFFGPWHRFDQRQCLNPIMAAIMRAQQPPPAAQSIAWELDVRKSYDQLGAALDVVDLTDLRRRVLELS
jgi:hypothetical protein